MTKCINMAQIFQRWEFLRHIQIFKYYTPSMHRLVSTPLEQIWLDVNYYLYYMYDVSCDFDVDFYLYNVLFTCMLFWLLCALHGASMTNTLGELFTGHCTTGEDAQLFSTAGRISSVSNNHSKTFVTVGDLLHNCQFV